MSFIPERDSDGRPFIYMSPFASKMVDGKKLYKRVHGTSASIAANSTGYITFVVPYAQCKFSGAEIINCKIGDTLDFMIIDDASGTYSTVPNYILNQFGFDVAMPNDYYHNTSNYDADLYVGMELTCAYKNNGTEAITIYMNAELHEVV